MRKGVIFWGLFWLIGNLLAIEKEEDVAPYFALYFTFFTLGLFLKPKRGYSRLNNAFWVSFANVAGIIFIFFREKSPKVHLNDLIIQLEKNELPNKVLIKKSGFNSNHPLWKKYNELKKSKDEANRRAAEKAKKAAAEAKIKKAKEREKREQEKKNRLLALKKKYGADATKALAGKIWVNMSFELYRQAQVMRPKGRKFGKKFENVVNGEERHTYRFDPYENRQGKISYNYEITTKNDLITGWKELN